jgi:alpha/beta superfamily hydrolase
MHAATQARLESLSLAGPAGPLEAVLRVPPLPAGCAVVAHPHPLHGGTMNTKVVHRAARLLCDRFDLLSLRFNFRGVGASGGTHAGGPGEVEDLVAAAAWVRSRQPEGPLVLGGFSFGSVCALEAASRVRPSALFLIGVPVLRFGEPEGVLPPMAVPAAWIVGDRDEFSPLEAARPLAARNGWRLTVVEGADHFFTGRLGAFEAQAAEALAEILPG